MYPEIPACLWCLHRELRACRPCADILPGCWAWRAQIPTSGSANVRVWCRLCRKHSCKIFSLCVCVSCTLHLMPFLFPAQCVGGLPHSLRAQPVLTDKHYSFKNSRGERTRTTAQETLPDCWLSVRPCGKPDVFAYMEQLDEPPAGKGKPPVPPCSHYSYQENLPAEEWGCPSHSP